jgi:hypothetical protein
MAHAKALRVIGQSLEVAKLRVFALETDGPNYVVTSDTLTPASEWILRHALATNSQDMSAETSSKTSRSVRFTPTDISRLDDQALKQRRANSTDRQVHGRLSQLLRTLGDHFDKSQVSTFQISWMYDSVSVNFHLPDGEHDSRSFTAEKLGQLGWHSRVRRFGRVRFNSNWPGSLKRP